jgi:hypothetical protein
VVIVTSDLVGFLRKMSDSIGARVHERAGIERERIVFNASHTHCGPLLGGFAPGAYVLEKKEQAAVDAYTRKLEDQLARLIVETCGKMRPAKLAYSEDQSDIGANRRIIRDGKCVAMGVNYDGLFERTTPVLRVSDQDDRPLAVLFGYSCHNTTLGAGVYKYNGDYAGYAQIALEKAHPGVMGMFMMGCGADSNPVTWCVSQPEKAEEFGNSLAAAVDRALAKPLHPIRGPLTVAFDQVDLPFADPATKEQLLQRRGKGDRYEQARTEFLVGWAAEHGSPPAAYPFPAQVVRFGDDLALIALSGETCVGYALRLRKELKGPRLWIAGFCNDVFAYVPTEQVLAEGGHEGAAAMLPYGWPSPFQTGAEDRVVELTKRLMASRK